MSSSLEPISLSNVADGAANTAFLEALQKVVRELDRGDLAPKPSSTITVKLSVSKLGEAAFVVAHVSTTWSPPKRVSSGRLIHCDDAGIYVDVQETDDMGNRALFPSTPARAAAGS